MIPVALKPEPADFDARVRQRGLAWLRARNLPLNGPLPVKTKLSAYWRECLDDLHTAYGSMCAFAVVQLEPVISNSTVEHFKPKSKYAEAIYEWNNFRLVCGILNGVKSDFEDVLDPCTIRPGTFELDAALEIHPGMGIGEPLRTKAQETIDRLKLNAADRVKLRTMYWTNYLKGKISAAYLRERSPFVASEMERLSLLDPNHQDVIPKEDS